jgi:UDP-glucuronate 4-epimerase
MTIERILVTGAAGFVGWHVVRALSDRGFRVRGVDNFDPFYSRRMKESGLHLLAPEDGFEFHELDVRHREAVGQALDGMDAVIHLAARPGVRQSVRAEDTYRSLNVHGTETLLAACRERGVRRIVFASSSSVYGRGVAPPWRETAVEGPPGSPYAATRGQGRPCCGISPARPGRG